MLAATSTVNALLALAGVIITAAFGFAAVLIQARRNQSKMATIVGHLDKGEDANGEPLTFREENREEHARIVTALTGIADTVEGHDRRIQRVEHEVGIDER